MSLLVLIFESVDGEVLESVNLGVKIKLIPTTKAWIGAIGVLIAMDWSIN